MSRELSWRNDFLLIRSQLHLPTGISDSLKQEKVPNLYVFLAFVSYASEDHKFR